MSGTSDRLARLVDGLTERGCDCAVLTGPSHAAHLLSYRRQYSGPTALLVDASGWRTFVVPAYEVEAAERHSCADAIAGYGDGGFGLDLEPTRALTNEAAAMVEARRIAIAGDEPGLAEAIAEAVGVEAVPIADLVAAVRAVKDPDEVLRIAAAYRRCLDAQHAVHDAARNGASEIELFTLAHATAQNRSGRPVEFGADVLVGTRTASVCGPVAVPGTTRPGDGDVVLADVAVGLDGYWGDTARTSVVGDRPEAEAVIEALYGVLADVERELRAGVTPAAIHELVASGVRAAHPEARFPHHAGHGIGVSGLEAPRLTPEVYEPLAPGMVVAVEPGAYLPGRFGVRIERAYQITPEGAVHLGDLDVEEAT